MDLSDDDAQLTGYGLATNLENNPGSTEANAFTPTQAESLNNWVGSASGHGGYKFADWILVKYQKNDGTYFSR